jgi:4-aminobutyrate aminotransferase-like enzyme
MLPRLITEVPGPESRALARRLRAHESRNVTFVSPGFPVFWQRGEGANIRDVDGNIFLDLTSGFGVATAGYSPTWLGEAVAAQVAVLSHGMGDVHPTVLKVELCAALSRLTFQRWGTGPGKVILGSAGFEAVEAALKTAFLATKKPRVLAFEGGYHGLGFGALSVTGWEAFRSPFRPQLRDLASFIPYPRTVDALARVESAARAALAAGDIGAILVEPAQGRGGEVFPPKGFLALLRRLAEESGALLVYDEIYSGFFRTGTWWACEHEGVPPDLVCMGKAMTGALPVSACVGRAEVMEAWPESEGEAWHTSTFLGAPLGMAAALASLRHWESFDAAAAVREQEGWWCHALGPLQGQRGVREVRGRGLMWGVELEKAGAAAALMEPALREGLIVLGGGPEGNVLSITPPLAMTEAEVEWAGETLGRLLRAGAIQE